MLAGAVTLMAGQAVAERTMRMTVQVGANTRCFAEQPDEILGGEMSAEVYGSAQRIARAGSARPSTICCRAPGPRCRGDQGRVQMLSNDAPVAAPSDMQGKLARAIGDLIKRVCFRSPPRG